MDEPDFPGVEADAAAGVGTGRSVFEIAFDDAADTGELAADLVVPPCHQFDGKQMITVRVREQCIAEAGQLGAGRALPHDERFIGFLVAGQPVFEEVGLFCRCSATERPVGLMHGTVAEHGTEAFQGLGGLGEEADAAHRPVEPVRHTHEYLSGLAVTGGDERLQGFGKGFVTGLVALDDFAGPFVEDEQVVVFV